MLNFCCPKFFRHYKGETYSLALTLLESWFPVVAAMSVAALGSLHSYFYSLALASLVLFLWWWRSGKLNDLRQKAAYWPLFMTSFLITSLYILLFIALQLTSATNVALILFLQVLFGYLFLGRRHEEKLGVIHLIGALMMMFGAMIVLFPGELEFRLGDFLVLLAAMIAPVANLYQKQARLHVSSQSILMIRSVIALPFVYLLASIFEPSPAWELLLSQFWQLAFVGVMILVMAKVLWIEAIHLLPITKVSAMFAFTPLLTLLWSDWFLQQSPHWSQLVGAIPILLGSVLLTVRKSS
ncbi:DMT family transporter [Thiomicrorhabdus xiamenensis]|uniref:DMT family transporter n=1 Tax=Thiomicrorhabdus xiamenensis TaxID=2739063 RepID=UPI001EE9DFDC|nr:DMT family transporter [Thiomicrorhabdus xiamenensis]